MLFLIVTNDLSLADFQTFIALNTNFKKGVCLGFIYVSETSLKKGLRSIKPFEKLGEYVKINF